MGQIFNASMENYPLYLSFSMGGERLQVGNDLWQRVGLMIQMMIANGTIDLSKGPLTISVKDFHGTDAKDMGLKIEQQVKGSWQPASLGPRGASKRQRARTTAIVNRMMVGIFQEIGPELAASYEAQKDRDRARERRERQIGSEMSLEVRAPMGAEPPKVEEMVEND